MVARWFALRVDCSTSDSDEWSVHLRKVFQRPASSYEDSTARFSGSTEPGGFGVKKRTRRNPYCLAVGLIACVIKYSTVLLSALSTTRSSVSGSPVTPKCLMTSE